MKDKIRITIGLLIVISVGIAGLLMGERTIIPGPDSPEALSASEAERIAIENGIPPRDTVLFTISHPGMSGVSAEMKALVEEFIATIRQCKTPDGNSSLFTTIRTAGHSLLGDELFISKDERHILVVGETPLRVDESSTAMKEVSNCFAIWKAHNPLVEIGYLGNGVVGNELFELINKDLDTSLIYTIPITLIILLWAFRSVAAALFTLFSTGLSLVCSLGTAAILSHLIEPISATAAQLIVLLVMAVGTDYTLFIISRIRHELSPSVNYSEAIQRTMATTGVAVFWSGITVATSLLGLFLMRDTVLTSMALVSIAAVFITMANSLLMVPAMLRILGDRIEWGTLRKASSIRFGGRWILWSTEKPILAIILSGLPLFAIALVCLKLTLGSTVQPQMMPESMQSIQTFKILEKAFPELAGMDLSIIMRDEDLEELEGNGDLQPFFDKLRDFSHVYGPIGFDRAKDGKTVRYRFSVAGVSSDRQNEELVRVLTERLIPEFSASTGVQIAVSGKLIYDVQQKALYGSRTTTVFGIVLGLSFIFLLIAFRSLVIPIKAILLNVLSTCAAFGLLVLCFQEYGFRYGVVESFVPALLFSILFGLSMDYHVYLISRIAELREKCDSTRRAVQEAVLETYSIISSAALIMVSVFLVVAMLELPVMKQLGVGLAFAVFIDATLVRCVLLPASMVLLDEWNWYLPFRSGKR